MRFFARIAWLCLTLVAASLGTAAMAEEIRADVIDVDQGGEVRLSLPAGASVSVGDGVRIEGEIPGVGWMPIKTKWTISYVSPDVVWAAPDGDLSGKPQIGYRAIISTAAVPSMPAKPKEPALPAPAIYSGVHDCDRLAAQKYDEQAVAPGVEYKDLDAQAIIAACEAAIRQWPETPRFYAQITRGYHKAGELKKAFEAAIKGSELGNAQATAFVAIFYKSGFYVRKDPAASLRWFVKASQQGNVAAMVFAGSMYNTGEGTPPNPGEAVHWFTEAARRGNGQAMSNLAMLYDAGRGVPRNANQAASLLLQALKLDDGYGYRILFNNANTVSVATRRKIQEMLRASGYYKGAIDGQIGPGTRRALDAFRKH